MSPPALATACCALISTHAGIKNDIIITMLRQIAIAFTLSLPKTIGIIAVVPNPTNVMATPKVTAPDKSQFFCLRASSRFPSPSVLPIITLVAE